MSQSRLLRPTAALLVSAVLVAFLGLSISRGATDSEAWAVLVQPTDLSVVLSEAVANNVAVREYRREVPVTATTSLGQIDIMTETFEVTFTELYTGQLALQTLRDEHWQHWSDMVSDWHRVATETLEYEQPSPDYDTVEDVDRIRRLSDAIAPITGCWDTGACPAVPHVVQVTVVGADADLAAFEQSNLVDFLYYFPDDDVSSLPRRAVSNLIASVQPSTALAAPPRYPEPPYDVDNWAPTKKMSMNIVRSGTALTHPSTDANRRVAQGLVWADGGLDVYANGEQEYIFEQNLTLNAEGQKYDPGTYLHHELDGIVSIFGTFKTMAFSCNLPACGKGIAYEGNQSWNKSFEVYSNEPHQLEIDRKYRIWFKVAPGEIHGTGKYDAAEDEYYFDDDIDNGVLQPALNSRVDTWCIGRSCSGLAHATADIEGIGQVWQFDPIPNRLPRRNWQHEERFPWWFTMVRLYDWMPKLEDDNHS